jgi:hypothetical protein
MTQQKKDNLRHRITNIADGLIIIGVGFCIKLLLAMNAFMGVTQQRLDETDNQIKEIKTVQNRIVNDVEEHTLEITRLQLK